jgi:hypothetical protein
MSGEIWFISFGFICVVPKVAQLSSSQDTTPQEDHLNNRLENKIRFMPWIFHLQPIVLNLTPLT